VADYVRYDIFRRFSEDIRKMEDTIMAVYCGRKLPKIWIVETGIFSVSRNEAQLLSAFNVRD
jgi:hypothetical protein